MAIIFHTSSVGSRRVHVDFASKPQLSTKGKGCKECEWPTAAHQGGQKTTHPKQMGGW